MAMADREPFVHIFFLDGVGLGQPDIGDNPFASAAMPTLNGLLGDGWFLAGRGRIATPAIYRHLGLSEPASAVVRDLLGDT